LILITPHIIANPEEGKILTEQFKKRLDWLEGQLQKLPPLNVNGRSYDSDASDDW